LTATTTELLESIEADKKAISTAKGIDKARIYERMGDSYMAMEKASKAVMFYRSAHEGGLDDPLFIDKFARSLIRSNQSKDAKAILEKALAKCTDPAQKARLTVTTAYLEDWIGSLEEAKQCCESAMSLLAVSGSKDKAILAEARILMGKTLWKQRRLDEALGFLEPGLEIYQGLKDPTGISDAYNTMGNVYYHKGDFNKSLDCYERSNKAKERAGYYNNAALIKWAQGKMDEAEELFRAALKKSMSMGNIIDIPRIQLNLADLGLEKNDLGMARIWLELTEKSMEEIDNKILASQIPLMHARMAFMEGNLDEASKTVEKVIPVVIREKRATLESMCYRLQGVIASAKGDHRTGKSLLLKSAERFRKAGMKYELACVLVNLAKTLQDMGDKDGSSKAADEAKDLFTQMGLDYELVKMGKLGI
jgi:tetratricopeptide (TPR) repeat protein